MSPMPNLVRGPGRLGHAHSGVDAVHPCYINLFPNYATREQTRTADLPSNTSNSLLHEVPELPLSFDHYPISATGCVTSGTTIWK